MQNKILVIKHGALGDIVLATGPFQAIRKHHPDAHITLLTTKPYMEMMRNSGYFDEIWVDSRPKIYNIFEFIRLIEKIRHAGFSRIYDLQTSERTGWYHKFMPSPKPEWVGTAVGASHRHDTPERTKLHTVERQKQQLAIAGIHEPFTPDLSWLKASIGRFNLPKNFALIVAGGSAHRTGKRWPAHNYGIISTWLATNGVTPVLIGTHSEEIVISTIETICSDTINLLGQTSFAELAELARHARCAVGNDTGPMHIIAITGCPSLILFSQFSDPLLCAPRGKSVKIIHEQVLAKLSPEKVIVWMKDYITNIGEQYDQLKNRR